MIREWSRFLTKPTESEPSREIDIGERSLDAIKPGWVQSIYWRAEKAIGAHRKGKTNDLDLFSGPPEADSPPEAGKSYRGSAHV